MFVKCAQKHRTNIVRSYIINLASNIEKIFSFFQILATFSTFCQHLTHFLLNLLADFVVDDLLDSRVLFSGWAQKVTLRDLRLDAKNEINPIILSYFVLKLFTRIVSVPLFGQSILGVGTGNSRF